ncbi:CHRD domain-containing protein [Deinococcus sp.]|uniref:CHRD domain-containing protein n=1 Tax=Deinococcus sp. TaxID=47478 RepID=UPI002869A405|nr:CHRD domain-containing protein [Deinococcus sp.]
MYAHKIILGIATTALLGSCSMMMGHSMTYTFKHNANAADAGAMGKAVASTKDGMVSTTLTLSGLTPSKAYIAHYHAFGPDSSMDACASNGPVTLGFPGFMSDASGNATVMVSGDMAKIAGDMGAYINVHYASDPSVVPICAAVKMTKG